MKRSVQEIIELLVFGLIAVLVGTGLLWLVGWVIGGLGGLFKLLAGLIWSLLRFVVPIAVVGAAVYALVRLLQGQREPSTSSTTSGAGTPGSAGAGGPSTAPSSTTPTSAPPPVEPSSTHADEPESHPAPGIGEQIDEPGDEGGEPESDASDEEVRRSADATHEGESGAGEAWENEDHLGEYHESSGEDHERDEDEERR